MLTKFNYIVYIYKKDFMIGIYKITTKHNNKMYIGSSENIESRWQCHLSRLKRNVHHSSFLQNVYNKHGLENLEFSIIEEITDKQIKLDREQYWINHFKSYNRKFGYNMSRLVRLNTFNERTIYQYSTEGNFIKSWKSIKNAEEKLKLTSISQALQGKNAKMCGGFQWRYKKFSKIDNLLKVYCCYNNKGELLKMTSDRKTFIEFLDIKNFNNISRCIKNSTTLKGFYIRIYDNYNCPKNIDIPIKLLGKKIVQKTKTGEVVRNFNSITEAAEFIKVDIGNLSRCISSDNSTYKTCKGFIWEYL